MAIVLPSYPLFHAHTTPHARAAVVYVPTIPWTVCACVYGRRSLSLFFAVVPTLAIITLDWNWLYPPIIYIHSKYTCPICRTAISMSHFVFDLSPPPPLHWTTPLHNITSSVARPVFLFYRHCCGNKTIYRFSSAIYTYLSVIFHFVSLLRCSLSTSRLHFLVCLLSLHHSQFHFTPIHQCGSVVLECSR